MVLETATSPNATDRIVIVVSKYSTMVIDSNSLSLIAGSRVVYAAVDLDIGDQEKIMLL